MFSAVFATSLGVGFFVALLPRSATSLSIKERAANTGYAFDYRHHGQDWTIGQCGSRERQSPVDFGRSAPWTCQATATRPNPCESTPFYFDYDQFTEGFTLSSNGRELVADLAGMGFGGITLDNLWFDMKNVSIHTGSEHTFQGERFPLELQIAHASSESDRVVIVAVPIRGSAPGESESNGTTEALNGLFAGLPLPAVGISNRKVEVNRPEEILAPLVEGGSFFVYGGSLTVPPCTAQTTWLVRREPLVASNISLGIARAGVNAANSGVENWREPMPLMGRHVAVMFAQRGHPLLVVGNGSYAPPDGVAEFRGAVVAREANDMARRTAAISDRLVSDIAAASNGLDMAVAGA